MVADDVTSAEPILEVGEFYELVTSHVESAFGRRRPRWVRGEIAKVFEKGHLYVDLVDAGSASSDAKRPVLNAHCWTSVWGPLKRKLADLASLRRELELVIGQCRHGTIAECRIIEALAPPRATHRHDGRPKER